MNSIIHIYSLIFLVFNHKYIVITGGLYSFESKLANSTNSKHIVGNGSDNDFYMFNATKDEKASLESSSSEQHEGEVDVQNGMYENEIRTNGSKSNDSRKEILNDLTTPSYAQMSAGSDGLIFFSSFNSRKTFSCPKIKTNFVSGTSVNDLSPEDVDIIAAMGDALATGRGLWSHADMDYRGAAFPIGGDATIDGLITIPNILREFNANLIGVSHGMGTKSQLPYDQLNVAEDGASSSNLPEQAKELVMRMRNLRGIDFNNEWVMVVIVIGTEEVCTHCGQPDVEALKQALNTLNSNIRKAFVILLGPIHVSSPQRSHANLMRERCNCSRERSENVMKEISKSWTSAFQQIRSYFEQKERKRSTFGILPLPMLTIASRAPYSLFIPEQPLLDRKGHAYATKWLWNRLISGPAYNVSMAILSQDAYYCPSMVCPYFRTDENLENCSLRRHNEPRKSTERNKKSRRTTHYLTALTVVVISFFSVFIAGSFLYYRKLRMVAVEIPPRRKQCEKKLDLSDDQESVTFLS